MKANELMVGDWVKIKTYGVSDKFERTEAHIYVKVAEIGSGLITVDYNNDIKEPYRICENTEIEPIPLTPEIFEKNGFEESYHSILTADGYKKLPQYKYKNMTQAQNVCRNLIIISYSDLDGGVYDIQCGIGSHIYNLKYVHQLQHALRICGIDKTIEL